MSSDRVMRWRLLLEEYGVQFEHISGKDNIWADSLSRHPIEEDKDLLDTPQKDSEGEVSELLALETINEEMDFPLQLSILREEQGLERKSCKEFKNFYYKNKDDFKYTVMGETEVLTYKGRIYVPKKLQRKTMQWYHYFLCHPGSNRLEKTMAHSLYWPNMAIHCMQFTENCSNCQMHKREERSMGNSHLK